MTRERSQNKPAESQSQSRRQFTRMVATSLISVPLATALVNAQTDAPLTRSAPQPTPTSIPNPQLSSPVAVAYAEVAQARFGKLVSPEQMVKIREDLEGNVRSAERLRNHKLENGDEPDFVFAAS